MISLKRLIKLSSQVLLNPPGTLLAIKSVRIGYRDANLGSLSTGVSTVYLLSVRNGIREICISKGILVMTIIESILETSQLWLQGSHSSIYSRSL